MRGGVWLQVGESQVRSGPVRGTHDERVYWSGIDRKKGQAGSGVAVHGTGSGRVFCQRLRATYLYSKAAATPETETEKTKQKIPRGTPSGFPPWQPTTNTVPLVVHTSARACL